MQAHFLWGSLEWFLGDDTPSGEHRQAPSPQDDAELMSAHRIPNSLSESHLLPPLVISGSYGVHFLLPCTCEMFPLEAYT